MVTNSAGEQVERLTVESIDDLLPIAKRLAGGNLDNFGLRNFYRGVTPDGIHRDIEFNLEGHANPPEGLHVKMSELVGNSVGIGKGNRWRTVIKVFVKGREFK